MDTLKILLFDEDKLTRTIIESYIKDLTFDCILEKYNEFNEAIIQENNDFKVIIANVNGSNNNLPERIAKISSNKNNKFIIVSNDNSTDLQVRSLRAGCTDFLLKPLVKQDFIYAIRNIYNSTGKSGKKKSAKVISAVSFEEKAGKTFFLLNLAKALSTENKVLFVDYNKSIYNFINKSNCSDENNNIRQYKTSNLYIMTPKTTPDTTELKKSFDYIFPDYNFKTNDDLLKLCNESDFLYIILTHKKPDIKAIKDFLTVSDKTTKIIINKYNKKFDNIIKKYQNELGQEAAAKIPNSICAAEQAKLLGETILEHTPNLDVSKCFKNLAAAITNGK